MQVTTPTFSRTVTGIAPPVVRPRGLRRPRPRGKVVAPPATNGEIERFSPLLRERDLVWQQRFQPIQIEDFVDPSPCVSYERSYEQNILNVTTELLPALEDLKQTEWYTPSFNEQLRCYIEEYLAIPDTEDQDARDLLDKLVRLSAGTYGKTYTSELQGQARLVLVKTPKVTDPDVEAEDLASLTHEYNIATGANGNDGTNILRQKLPSFVYVYYALDCGAPIDGPVPDATAAVPNPKARADLWCTPGGGAVNLLEEYIPGQPINSELLTGKNASDPNKLTADDFSAIFLQKAIAAWYAWNTIGYAHNDDSSNNNLAVDMKKPVNLALPLLPPFQKNRVYIVTRYLNVQIDFGQAQSKSIGTKIGTPLHDMFFFLLHTAYILRPGNKNREVWLRLEYLMRWFTDLPLTTLIAAWEGNFGSGGPGGNILPVVADTDPIQIANLIKYIAVNVQNGPEPDSRYETIDSANPAAYHRFYFEAKPGGPTIHDVRRWQDAVRLGIDTPDAQRLLLATNPYAVYTVTSQRIQYIRRAIAHDLALLKPRGRKPTDEQKASALADAVGQYLRLVSYVTDLNVVASEQPRLRASALALARSFDLSDIRRQIEQALNGSGLEVEYRKQLRTVLISDYAVNVPQF